MAKLDELRRAAQQIFEDALRAVDPATAVRNAVRLVSSSLVICGTAFEFPPETNVFAVAIGKAAAKMAGALEAVLGDQFKVGVIAAPYGAGRAWQHFDGGHPLPNAASFDAAEAAFRLLDRANNERALVFFLISGGGSAMLEWPVSDAITLEDLCAANEILIGCGASIGEINAVRRAFSAVKGERLARRAPKSRQVTLIVSDVPQGEEHNVASGPTWPPPPNAPSAAEVIARYGLTNHLPGPILRVIENPLIDPPLSPNRSHHFVLLDNDVALKAAMSAAQTQGFSAEMARDISDDPIEIGCDKLMKRFINMQKSDLGTCLISGGEFACPVRGPGTGGRNLETALRLAMAAEKDCDRRGEFVALCAGTDGIDGNSSVAGAIIDSTTLERARRLGLDPMDFLNRSDSGAFFEQLGDAITIGPTGTNVRDVRILLRGAR